MIAELHIGDVAVDLVFKDIKNIHLSVYPPTGRVRIAAPSRMNIETIRAFAISKLSWIRQHQVKFEEQERETPREYLDRESHYLWGKRFLLDISETDGKPSLFVGHQKFHLFLPSGSTSELAAHLFDEMYRKEVRAAAEILRQKWQKILCIEINQIYIQRMKTRWGSCNPSRKNIRLNLDLAKKPDICLEYILLHEIIHCFEPTHNAKFVKMMDQYMFNWRFIRQQLNNEPLSHADWKY
jgi:predicted metal-dependent hydrolase